MEEIKRIYRSESNRVIAGVCGGLGEYFNVDATLLRLIFILATIFGGSGLLVYVLLWILLPKESSIYQTIGEETIRDNIEEIKESAKKVTGDIKEEFENRKTKEIRQKHESNWFAYFLIVLGSVILMSKLGLIRLDIVWPILLIGLGILILLR